MRRHKVLLIQVCYLAALVATTAGQAGAGQLAKARTAARGSESAPKPQAEPSSGKLDNARQAARPPRSEHHDDLRRPSHGHAAPYCGAWSFAGAGLWSIPRHTTCIIEQPTIVQAAPAPAAWAPAPQQPITPELRRTFARFPHAGDQGFADLQPVGFAKPWLGAVRFEIGSDLDGLSRSGLGVQLEGSLGWALDFKYDTYRESLPGGGYDELRIADVNAMYRVVETERSLIRVGMGVNFLGDAVETDTGVNFTIKADFAPWRPVVVSTELDMGTVGHAETLHGAATVGVMTDRLELFGGYDYRRVGEAELQGPMLGLRIWF
ncbi:hypothetical protein Pla123a_47220 [Posidoniimonas polymericola]|uniref:Outer membrane protein beta-barrel domain-containing protein n=1 Tax=Posidoniimonas polymericola TaxID=2528002 RepID=A0A5C5XUC7_9BACT|nr:hypothetical protein [Posidoniimonas polymericola]TWT66328.1 hypothetical protein Pla123a_47220 [Posidoniimonas polymericola]